MESLSQYKFANRAFYAVSADREKLVARVDAGKVVYEKGCAGPHKASLSAWIKEQGISFESERSTDKKIPSELPEASDKSESESVPSTEKMSEDEAIIVESIPESELPAFDLMLGVATPGFEDFVKIHHIAGFARVALINRLVKIARR